MTHPRIIQGGMGIGVSDWKLANAVASRGALGVVSGTALDSVLARRLEQGDQGGHMRRGLAAFPDRRIADRILARWFRADGTPETHDFSVLPMRAMGSADSMVSDPSAIAGNDELDALTVAANFVEVYLAMEGHSGFVGINFLEKVQLPNPAAIYGAMLAGVDYVLMGAGIPLEIPGLLDRYSRGECGEIRVQVSGAAKDEIHTVRFDPSRVMEAPPVALKRPYFLAIVSSYILAMTMVTRASGTVDGIVVENHTAGGHNAPPRGVLSLDVSGEPMYGPKDTVDYAKMVGLNVPFWLGGSYSREESLSSADGEGAAGIQVGTLFAFCSESGLLPELKRRFLEAVSAGKAFVRTHPHASPTGYPFKLALLGDTLSEKKDFIARKRVCNVGLLRELFRTSDGSIGYRCPAESEPAYAAKGGDGEKSGEARCLCNALLANIGLGMKYAGERLEQPLLTVGNQLESLRLVVAKFGMQYSARDVIAFLESRAKVRVAART